MTTYITALGTPITVTTGFSAPSDSQIAVLTDGTLLVGGYPSGNGQCSFAHYSASGELINTFAVDNPNGSSVAGTEFVALSGGGFAVTFAMSDGQAGADEIYSRAYTNDGLPASGFVHINGQTLNNQSEPFTVATPSGGYYVDYTDGSNSNTSFVPLVNSSNPLNNNGAAEAQDVRGRIVAANGTSSQDFLLNAGTKAAPGSDVGNYNAAAGEQRSGGSAALANGSIVTPYIDVDYYSFINSGNGYSHDLGSVPSIGMRLVTASGVSTSINVNGDELPPSTYASSTNRPFHDARPQAVALSGGGFAVVWTEQNANTSPFTLTTDVRYFNSDGTPTSNPIALMSRPSSNVDANVLLAPLPNGSFAMAYQTVGSGNSQDTQLAVIDASGTLVGNTTVASGPANQTIRGLSAAPDGSLYIGFHDSSSNTNTDQRYVVQQTGDFVKTGSSGNDTIISTASGSSKTWIDGGVGNDTITGGAGHNQLYGGAGNDVLTGGTGSDLLDGGTGDDKLVGGGGTDTLDGGAGIDTAQFSLSRKLATISHDLTGHVLVDSGGNDHAILSNFERYQFTDALLTNPSTAHDFGGDGHADILYRQNSSGNTVLAQLNGSHAAAPSAFTGVQLGPDWNIVSTASDFNNDGHADILFRNAASGATILSEMNGAQQLAPSAFTDVQVNNSYAIAGTADFNGDGNADILYRNVATGQTVLSELNGPHQAAPSAFTDVQLDNSFAVAGTGDFNGDGKADILYRKASSGSTLIAFQNGPNQAAPSAFTDVQVGNDYKVWVGDFDGDGKSDLLFRNVNTGQTAVSLMDGSHQKAPTAFTDVQLNNQFEIAQVSDFNGDGTADILFRNATSGATLVAFMNGAHQAAPSAFTDVQVDHSWSIV